jgi:exopolysaccharide biosynthesis WecB/TagA/CpsF family protein
VNTARIRIRIFHPADPLGVGLGGVESFLRGLIKWAPADLEFSMVGVTTDEVARPVGRWTRCRLGNADFEFFPVLAAPLPGAKSRIPLSVRFSVATQARMAELHGDFEVFDFHRLEPSLLFLADGRPKSVFLHADPQSLRQGGTDTLWKHLPVFYEGLESRAMSHMRSAWCVRESGAQALRARYPDQAQRIRFVPTWVDPEVFHPLDAQMRARLRRKKAKSADIDETLPWVISAGALEPQQDPLLMLRSMALMHSQGTHIVWVVAGEGSLRSDIERGARRLGLHERVCFVGSLPPSELADWFRACDAYALSSVDEGMSMALLEALACGLPAAVTDVGEVQRVVHPGRNGAVAVERSSDEYARALAQVIDHAPGWRGAPSLSGVSLYHPADVMAPVYANYRVIGEPMRALRQAADGARANTAVQLLRIPVVGIPIDTLDRVSASRRMLGWAREHQSRYVCFINVHSAVHAAKDERHRQALLGADFASPDGAPIAWSVGVKAGQPQQRVDGPGMTWRLCQEAAEAGIKVGFYGSSRRTLQALAGKLKRRIPKLNLAYLHSPPFRELTPEEDAEVCSDIAQSGVGLLFVGLGCPKQEAWMAEHRGRIPAVMLGVGAAFDFHAGTVARAPQWMRDRGLEWLHRMASQPRRLGPRYLHTNSLFLAKSAVDAARTLATEPSLNRRPGRAEETPVPPQSPPMKLDTRPIEHLVTRVATRLPSARGRLIGFIASGSGEGTSTLARAYVETSAGRMQRRVLLLDAAAEGRGAGVMHALAAQRSLTKLLRPMAGGGMRASMGGSMGLQAQGELVARMDLWDELRSRFDEIVLDLPAASASHLGLALAPYCDGVVVVLEAEKTRAPVVQNLIADLKDVQANVLGTVLNRRRYHVPARIYRWL